MFITAHFAYRAECQLKINKTNWEQQLSPVSISIHPSPPIHLSPTNHLHPSVIFILLCACQSVHHQPFISSVHAHTFTNLILFNYSSSSINFHSSIPFIPSLSVYQIHYLSPLSISINNLHRSPHQTLSVHQYYLLRCDSYHGFVLSRHKYLLITLIELHYC